MVEEDELLVAVGLVPVLAEVEEGGGDEEEDRDLGEEISGQDLMPHETLHLSLRLDLEAFFSGE